MFKSDLILKPYGSKDWILMEPLLYQYGSFDSQLITVPKGFTTDLASIPRIARLLIPVNGPHRRAAVIHDWLYVNQHINGFRIQRREADKMLLQAMKETDVPSWMRHLIYWGVRIGGNIYWNKHKKEMKQ